MATGDPVYGKTNVQRGFRLIDGHTINTLVARVFQGGINRRDGITARAGGTQAAATQLINSLNRVAICATANDSVALPKAIAGSMVIVLNDGAATLAVYSKPGSGDTINGGAATAAVTQATTVTSVYLCLTKGLWLKRAFA